MKKTHFVSIICILILLISLVYTPALAQTDEDLPVLTVSTSYKSLFSTSEQTGMLDRIVKEAFQRIGIKTEIVFNPTGRSSEDVN
ncbi:MAG TPA: hypothetical protein PKJ95_06405, partial [Atribacterota bacterium]|nr:hypothetical protein [Atribacterota bacterium]